MENITEAKLQSMVRRHFGDEAVKCPRCGAPVIRDVRGDYGGKGWCFACGWVYYGNGFKPAARCGDNGDRESEPAGCVGAGCPPQGKVVARDPLLESLAGMLEDCGDCGSCRAAKRCRQIWLDAVNAAAARRLRAGVFRRLALRFYDLQQNNGAKKGLANQQSFARAERQ